MGVCPSVRPSVRPSQTCAWSHAAVRGAKLQRQSVHHGCPWARQQSVALVLTRSGRKLRTKSSLSPSLSAGSASEAESGADARSGGTRRVAESWMKAGKRRRAGAVVVAQRVRRRRVKRDRHGRKRGIGRKLDVADKSVTPATCLPDGASWRYSCTPCATGTSKRCGRRSSPEGLHHRDSASRGSMRQERCQ